MFWGCFSYDLKGPCHIWQKETVEERLRAQGVLDSWNESLEPEYRRRWEAAQTLLLLSRNRRQRGRPAQWKFTKANGKLVREAKRGGIDWFRYLLKVVPKIFPFAERLKEILPNVIVQEDRAGPHAHIMQGIFYDFFQLHRLLWPGNSPDLNAIEPCWMYLKKETTKDGPPRTREEAAFRWFGLVWFYSYAEAGVAHADLLSSYRKRKTLWGIKASPSAFLMSTCCLFSSLFPAVPRS
jgi:hypothetical protein